MGEQGGFNGSTGEVALGFAVCVGLLCVHVSMIKLIKIIQLMILSQEDAGRSFHPPFKVCVSECA